MRMQRKLVVALGVAVIAASPAWGKGTKGTKKGTTTTTPKVQTPPPTVPPKVVNPAQAAAESDDAKATTALGDLVKKLTADFQLTPDYLKAAQAVIDANAAYEVAKAPVIAALSTNDPKYKLAKARYVAAQKKYDQLKADDAEQADIVAAGGVMYDLGNLLGQMEEAACEADLHVLAAKRHLDDLVAAVNKLMDDFKAGLAQNADYIAAKQAKDDADKKLAALK